MSFVLTLLALACAAYISYILLFSCKANKIQIIQPLKRNNQSNLKVTEFNLNDYNLGFNIIEKPKKRVTIIREGSFPGLYDNGILIDDLIMVNKYDAQELAEAEDSEYYTDKFFKTQLELKKAFENSKIACGISKMITEELK